MQHGPSSRRMEWLVSAPSLLWLTLFFLLPLGIIFAIAFRPPDLYGGIGSGWTIRTILDLGNPSYPVIVWRTFWLSALATAISLLLGVPCAYCMARADKQLRQTLLLLVILPFWTSFLIRVFAWKVLLHPEGPVKRVLCFFHLVDASAFLLYNEWAVLLVMVYTGLPFAILPLYAAAEKFDFRLLEAARDLGASPFRAFTAVFIPGIRRGLLTALLVVFIPSLGSYIIPDLVGGPQGEMVGNKIAQRTYVDRNLPHAAALSAGLTLCVLLPLAGCFLLQKRHATGRSGGGK